MIPGLWLVKAWVGKQKVTFAFTYTALPGNYQKRSGKRVRVRTRV